jgi:acetyl esterase/lipase
MSIRNTLLKVVLRATRKPIYASERSLRSHVLRVRSRGTLDRPPASAERIARFERRSFNGTTIYTVRPRGDGDPKGHILYLHGGGFFEGMDAVRWRVAVAVIPHRSARPVMP